MKKRKQVIGNQPTEVKRFKLEDEGLTDKDRYTLSRWKHIQQTTRPFIHPIRKLVKPGELPDVAFLQQQDLTIKQQSSEIEKLQKQISECEKMMKDQNHLISKLTEKHKAIILECKKAGLKLPQDLLDESTPKLIGNSCQGALPSTHPQVSLQSNPALVQQTLMPRPLPPPPSTSTLTPVSPANVFSPPMITSAYPNTSPTNRTPPPAPPLRIHPSSLHTHRPPVSIVPLSSSCTTINNSNASTYPQLNPRQMAGMLPHHNQFNPPSQMVMVGGHTGHAQNQIEIGEVSQVMSSRQQLFGLGKTMLNPPGGMLIDDISFSPLTSSELKELEHPPSIGNSYPAPPISFADDLDSILNITMPSGSGAGYGVGVKEEELPRGTPQIDLRYVCNAEHS